LDWFDLVNGEEMLISPPDVVSTSSADLKGPTSTVGGIVACSSGWLGRQEYMLDRRGVGELWNSIA